MKLSIAERILIDETHMSFKSSAFQKTKNPELIWIRGFLVLSWQRDLNPRPADYKSAALPAELCQQFSGYLQI